MCPFGYNGNEMDSFRHDNSMRPDTNPLNNDLIVNLPLKHLLEPHFWMCPLGHDGNERDIIKPDTNPFNTDLIL